MRTVIKKISKGIVKILPNFKDLKKRNVRVENGDEPEAKLIEKYLNGRREC